MGISYRADVAYGFMLTEDEMIEIATDRGYESKYYETLQDAIDENDFEYDFAEWFSKEIGLGFCTAGNAYWDGSGTTVFGSSVGIWDCDFQEIDLSRVDCAKVDAICAELGREPKWYLGCSVS